MTTNALLAVKTESGVVGRYLHSDGYPDHVLPQLTTMIERDGGARVAATLLAQDRGGWSSLDFKTLDASEGKVWAEIPGYGSAYRDADPESPIRWEDAVADVDFEYGYVLDPETNELEAYDLHGGRASKITLDEFLAVDRGE